MGIEHVGPYLQRCRKAQHLTQDALAQQLGVTTRTISKWETGRETPGAETLARFVDLVHADPTLVYALLLSHRPTVGAPVVSPAVDEHAWVQRLLLIEEQIDQEERAAVQQAIETLLRGWLPRDQRSRPT